MQTTISLKLEHSTRSIGDTKFSVKKNYQESFQRWEKAIGDISFEDKLLLEDSKNDFENNRTVSRRKVMNFLSK